MLAHPSEDITRKTADDRDRDDGPVGGMRDVLPG